MKEKNKAVEVAEKWLTLVDEGKYGESREDFNLIGRKSGQPSIEYKNKLFII